MKIEIELNNDQAKRLSSILDKYLAEFYHDSEDCKKDRAVMCIVENAILEAKEIDSKIKKPLTMERLVDALTKGLNNRSFKSNNL